MSERKILSAEWWPTKDGCIGIVAVEGENGDWAAYIGVGRGANIRVDEIHIAEWGAKMHPDHARIFFDWLDIARYRR